MSKFERKNPSNFFDNLSKFRKLLAFDMKMVTSKIFKKKKLTKGHYKSCVLFHKAPTKNTYELLVS